MERTIAVILGGGRGTRLYPLTKYRSKPAVPFGGMYRLIDIPVSNCLNSGINRIFVVTQFNSASLNRHVSLTYNFDAFREGFVSILAAEQTPETMDWYQGTADAVRKNLRHLRPTQADDVIILSGDHIYSMDYRAMLALHRRHRADITIAALPVPAREIHRFGILRMNDDGRIGEFCEKPASTEPVKHWGFSREMFGGDRKWTEESVFMASMGIYVIRYEALEEILRPEFGEDFGRHIIPRAISDHRVYAYPFTGYWEDIGTIRSYYDANLALTDPEPKFQLFDPQMRLFTRPRFLPGAHAHDLHARSSLICAGCRTEDVNLDHSILGTRAIVKSGAQVSDAVIVGADYYETSEGLAQNRERNLPDVGIGGDTTIRRAIVDKNARIGYGVTIDPGVNHPDTEGEGYAVRDSIVIIEKDAVIPDGAVIPSR
jgi:glucose-1-phosphate adenylyltransferase